MCTFFYHSGLEAYCKCAAAMLGDERLVLNLCQDILPDRTQKKLARTWCLSNQRRGPANRMSIFEDQWLDDGEYKKAAMKEYRSEALVFYQIQHPEEDHPAPQVPAGGFLTITPNSSYEDALRKAIDEADCERIAQNRCETDAIYNCVDGIVGSIIHEHDAKVADGLAGVKSIFRAESFKERFKNQVIPAVEHGFLCEGYQGTDIRWFRILLEDRLDALPDLAADYSNVEEFRSVLTTIVSGLVYGPGHPLVRTGSWDDSTRNASVDHAKALHAELEPKPGAAITIRLTQVLDKDCRYTGFSEVFAPSVAVFVGRCAELKDYLTRCRDVFEDRPEVLAALNEREKIVFPIPPTCGYVSWIHALLICEEENNIWRAYELGSKNGSVVQGLESGDAQAVESVLTVVPGDKLTFGAPDVNDAAAYQNAVTLLLTFDVDRSMQLG